MNPGIVPAQQSSCGGNSRGGGAAGVADRRPPSDVGRRTEGVAAAGDRSTVVGRPVMTGAEGLDGDKVLMTVDDPAAVEQIEILHPGFLAGFRG